MAHMVFCVRNKQEMEGLDEPPFDSEFGQKIYKNVSKQAWAEWAEANAGDFPPGAGKGAA